MANGRVLIIDDEKNYLLILQAILEDEGYEVTTINDPEMVMPYLEDSEVDVVITDMKMPKITGKELLEHVKKNYPRLPVLIMTAFGSIESAVEVMRHGDFDYITKTFSNDELLISLHNAIELSKTHSKYQILRESLEERFSSHQIIGKSKAILETLALVDRVAQSKSSVLICGEAGTGKSSIARALHFASPRKDMPFVAVNCKAFTIESLDVELFGQESSGVNDTVAMKRGRIELADQGTLYLSEIGALSMELQVKLLRVLQDKNIERVGGTEPIPVDVRIVVSTAEDLNQFVLQGKFREDLLYRLNVVKINMPPLRERREDIPLLVAHFINKICAENNMPQKYVSNEALNYLNGYEWQGNIRQLQNVVERCVIMVAHKEIGVEDLPPEIKDEDAQFKSAVDLLPPTMDLAETLDKIEGAVIRRALVRADFVQSRAAEMLGISRSLMQYKLKKYNITGH